MISAKRPKGHINDWPGEDAVAWQEPATVAERSFSLLGLSPIDAYHDAALVLCLEGFDEHWLVDDALAHLHRLFYSRDNDFYLDPASWLQLAGPRDCAKSWMVVLATSMAGEQERWSVGEQL